MACFPGLVNVYRKLFYINRPCHTPYLSCLGRIGYPPIRDSHNMRTLALATPLVKKYNLEGQPHANIVKNQIFVKLQALEPLVNLESLISQTLLQLLGSDPRTS